MAEITANKAAFGLLKSEKTNSKTYVEDSRTVNEYSFLEHSQAELSASHMGFSTD